MKTKLVSPLVNFALAVLALLVVCTACTTVPKFHEDAQFRVDSSTPSQYPQANNGFIGYTVVDGKKVGIFTPNKRDEYNNEIAKYAVQFKDVYLHEIKKDEGITPWVDSYGNHLYIIDGTHLIYAGYLAQWRRDARPGDTIWQKAGL